jgi:hypothetical protein
LGAQLGGYASQGSVDGIEERLVLDGRVVVDVARPVGILAGIAPLELPPAFSARTR